MAKAKEKAAEAEPVPEPTGPSEIDLLVLDLLPDLRLAAMNAPKASYHLAARLHTKYLKIKAELTKRGVLKEGVPSG